MNDGFYGAPDYEKARKIIEADKLRVLIRNRIGITDCWHGKPLRPKWDDFYDSVKVMIQDYLDAYDATQEYEIDAILDFMPATYTETGVYDAIGVPSDEFYCPPTPYDFREHHREMFLAMWCHDKGLAGWLEEEFQSFSGRDNAYGLAKAKAFNRLCRSVSEEVSNNAKIAEYILSEGIEPPSDSEYKKALDELNQSIDNGDVHDLSGQWPDYREQKGLPTNISYEMVPNPDTDDGYPKVVRPISPQSEIPEVDDIQSADDEVSENLWTEGKKLGGFGIVDWVDSKLNPLERNNPGLYKLVFVLLSPVMIPLAVIEGILQGLFGAFKGLKARAFEGPEKKQWYQQDDDGNWIPVVIDEVTGETTPGTGLS